MNKEILFKNSVLFFGSYIIISFCLITYVTPQDYVTLNILKNTLNITTWVGDAACNCNCSNINVVDGCTWNGINCCSGSATVCVLDVSNRELHYNLPTQIGLLTNLQDLHLNNNYFTGDIPLEYTTLTNLQYLDMGGNCLNGTIPTEIGLLSNLTYLNLAFNKFTGILPTQIGQLVYLTNIDISQNNFTGAVPIELINLFPSTSSRICNLVNNNFNYPCFENTTCTTDCLNVSHPTPAPTPAPTLVPAPVPAPVPTSVSAPVPTQPQSPTPSNSTINNVNQYDISTTEVIVYYYYQSPNGTLKVTIGQNGGGILQIVKNGSVSGTIVITLTSNPTENCVLIINASSLVIGNITVVVQNDFNDCKIKATPVPYGSKLFVLLEDCSSSAVVGLAVGLTLGVLFIVIVVVVVVSIIIYHRNADFDKRLSAVKKQMQEENIL